MTNKITTKKEAATMLADRGIALPDNWSKLSTERAISWAELEAGAHEALAADNERSKREKPKKVGVIAHGAAALAAAVLGMGHAVADALGVSDKPEEPARTDRAARKNAALKVFSDPKYRRTTRKMRRLMSNHRGVNFAADPVPMTRQVARRKALDVGLKASDFRQFMGA